MSSFCWLGDDVWTFPNKMELNPICTSLSNAKAENNLFIEKWAT